MLGPDNAVAVAANDHDFAAAENKLLIEQSRIGAWLMLVLVPAGISLDYFVYPQFLGHFAGLRLFTDLFVVAAIALHRRPLEASHPRILIGLWLGSAIVMICAMVYITDGARSSYYDGLVLAILAVGILLPLRLADVLTLTGATLALYALASLAPGAAPFDAAAFFNANYFLLLAGIISATAVHFAGRRRRREFLLRGELEEKNRQMAELDRMKSRFFANISHELRTPLTSILAPTQDLLARSQPNTQQAAALKTVEASALRLLRLVDNLLDLIRFDQTATVPQTGPVDLGALLKALVDETRYLARSKGIALDAEIPSSFIVQGDAADLERIFINLISNAVKFTERNGSIMVRAEAAPGQAHIAVADSGIGMTSQDAARIFDRFQQVDSSGTRRYQGLGLGLALVKELLERNSGTISVETALGEGTTIHVRLALAQSASTETPSTSLAPPNALDAMHRAASVRGAFNIPTSPTSSPQQTRSPDAATVLVADDEPEVLHFLASLFAREFIVVTACDGAEALSRVTSMRPDLAVLDLMMPQLDGLEVCRRIKNDDALNATKVIVLTARVDEQAKLQALAHGADDFISKPFSTTEVLTRARNLLRTAKIESELRIHNAELRDTLRRLHETEAQLLHHEKLKALGTMAAGLLHEINNPLNFTGLAAAIAAKHTAVRSDAKLAEVVADIADGIKRVQSIITDLRTFANERPVESPQPFNVAHLVYQALRFTATEVAHCRISVDVADQLWATGLEQQLCQVLINLLLNAARACKQACRLDPAIAIVATQRASRVFVSVSDNGCGIGPERLSRIFDPFYTTSEVGMGMGLGLSISHTIVERHQGHLNVTSQQDVGSTLSFDIAHYVPVQIQQRSHVTAP